MNRILSQIIVVLCLIFLTTPSFALGKIGHRVLCQLSYDLLTDDKKNKIDQLLELLPNSEKKRIDRYNSLNKAQPISFADSCTWADAIKSDKTYDKFKSSHYLNVNRNVEEINAVSCPSSCLTTAIFEHQQQLFTSQNNQQKLIALMFLGHWLGDIHQPLHVSFASDLGGNNVKIQPYIGKCNNLHWYWDHCLLFSRNKYQGETQKDYYQWSYQQLYKELSNSLTTQLISTVQRTDVMLWANESLSIIRADEFNYCQLNGDYCQRLTNDKIILSSHYHHQYREVLKKRILQGAVRLSVILSIALK
jgi:hypothetical protein